MRRLTFILFLLAVWVPVLGAQKKPGKRAAATVPSDTIPVTTASPEARKLFEQGMVKWENLHTEGAQEDWRAAVYKDPNFAQAWAFLAFNSRDPKEEAEARKQAKDLARDASPGERKLIVWITGVREGDFVPAIAAMNDLFQQYPRDKRFAYLVSGWLLTREEYGPAQRILERAMAADPGYAPGYNNLAYAYAYARQFDKAFAAMEKYTALLPNEPNPQDSYAEILRMAGKFDQALEHYRAALKIDPKFPSSQVGIADTYALMGEYDRAREEYPKAIVMAPTPADKANYRLQEAMTWVREKKYDEADQAFTAAAEQARADGLMLQEAQAQRMMAVYAPDAKAAASHLDRAELALADAKDLSETDRQEEVAAELRVRATRAAMAGQKEAAQQALEALAEVVRSDPSTVIQRTYEATQGALLEQEGKYAEAIPHLQEDAHNALSAQLLLLCYQKTGAAQQAKDLASWLAGLNEPTLEQALVVPEFRAQDGGKP
ncbi:MAG TPA: tetratricopeptide repeat protein [Terriglobales bacterium]|jgi:tetratricopeptide (TPR) repeat protein|nr:tetratricopeptide repeat protein [Terriglobales bacterium]